ncbi:MAG: hypothetical protein OWQ54_05910 [Sulfolobaceae archaeon]|nr:hypothetical protein [Sulfolobaceae archaeon]
MNSEKVSDYYLSVYPEPLPPTFTDRYSNLLPALKAEGSAAVKSVTLLYYLLEDN